MKYIKGLLILLILLYLTFMIMDIYEMPTSIIKYASICICFSISIIGGYDSIDKKGQQHLQAGLFLTLFADLCLLILNYFLIGIAFFLVVQLIYIKRHSGLALKVLRKPLLMVIGILLSFSLVSMYYNFNIIYLLGTIYAIALITSLITAIKSSFPYPNKLILIIGMSLFFLCDINVAIFNLTTSGLLFRILSLSMWLFYLPSQTLLSISGSRFKKESIICYNNTIRKIFIKKGD